MANIISAIKSNIVPGPKRVGPDDNSIFILRLDGDPTIEGCSCPPGSVAIYESAGISVRYIKNGPEDLDWEKITTERDIPTKIVLVNQENVSTTLGGTIDSAIMYLVDGEVDCTGVSFEVPAGGIFLSGHNIDLSKLICTDAAYTMFTSPIGGSGNFFAKSMNFEVSGAGSQVYNLEDATGFNAHEISRVNYNNCTSLGTLTNYRQGLETGTGRFGGKPSLILEGTWIGGFRITTSIVRSLTDGVYSLFEAGGSFTMASRFLTDMNCDLPASASLLDFAPANFTNPSTLQINGALISRDGVFDAGDSNLTPNISHEDIASNWDSNTGLANTFEGGRLTVSSESTTTVIADTTYYDIAGTWAADNLQHFDSPGNGQLRHLGTSPREYRITLNLVLASGANDQLSVRIRMWDNSASSFVNSNARIRQVNFLAGIRNVAIYNYAFPIVLDQNDYIILQVANNSGTADVTAELDSDWFIEER